jgi:hypothetical protein
MANCPRTSQRAGGTVGLRGGLHRVIGNKDLVTGGKLGTFAGLKGFPVQSFPLPTIASIFPTAALSAANPVALLRTHLAAPATGSQCERATSKVVMGAQPTGKRHTRGALSSVGGSACEMTPDKNRLSGATHDGPSMSSELPPCRRPSAARHRLPEIRWLSVLGT